MEEDEGETSLAVEKSSVADGTESQDSATVEHNTNKEKNCSIGSLVGKDAIKSSECSDNLKLSNEKNVSICEFNSQNSNDKQESDSDVPKSPKKVNGEVELSKCDNVESKSGIDCSEETSVVEVKKPQEVEHASKPESGRLSRKCKQKLGHITVGIKNTGPNSDRNLEYKGFKKRILARTSAAGNKKLTDTSRRSSPKSLLKYKKAALKKTIAESRHVLVSHQTLPDGTQSSAQLTEYAQYLGLQPTVKFKCYKCGESGFPSMSKLQEHQNTCLKNVTKMQSLLKPPVPQSSEPAPSTNFRITRKVYLCSACGTYYENWNLFLHMREVHKRHICLFCLGMFSQADKLASHLTAKHGVSDVVYNSLDQFQQEYKGSFFMMCCTCERLFTESENFYDHSCNEGLVINAENACSLCGLRGAHFPTCRRAFTDSTGNMSPPTTNCSPIPVTGNPLQTSSGSQAVVSKGSITVTKYLIPVNRSSSKVTNQTQNLITDNMGENQDKSKDLSDIDDEYDISNAASFCHVNIHEPSEKEKPVPKIKTYKGKKQNGVAKKVIDAKSPSASPPPSPVKVPSPAPEKNENTDNSELSNQIENEVGKSTNIDPDSAVDEKRESQESDEREGENSEASAAPDAHKKSDEMETNLENKSEQSNSDTENKSDSSKACRPLSPAVEESDIHAESNVKEVEEQADLKSLQGEINSMLSPKSDSSPKTSPRTETKVTAKTVSAMEADSESESSDSGEDTDSSSSTDASSEESDRHDEMEEKKENEEKVFESDVDNADSDRMSLVVDENRSEDDGEAEFIQQEKQEKEDEEKPSESDEMKKDEASGETDEQKEKESEENRLLEEEKVEEPVESVQLADDEVPLLELTLEENLDGMSIQMLLKESVKVSCLNCVYCNHAKKIAVNGKQLALHLLAEHRFAPVVCSDSGELTEADGFIDKLKSSLPELQQMFFNTDTYDNMDESCVHPYDRTYECFHCHFVTTLHKELYVHNRKMHQKTILLCIMCKSNFYSYSELLCHLCPGIYVPESNINFRCCLCTVDGLPSAFRLMVHLRKRHHACDVCLETTGDQQKLSNHVWKHKLHHLCYRCGIAYRNKPDITKHLFWKHGTESVVCKKCLQKKWPHVYHFCIPPNAFVCEECNSSFSRAVALKVHKRLHADDQPYPCNECDERFISRKLLAKHQEKHREPPPEDLEEKITENDSKDDKNHQEVVTLKTNDETESHSVADALTNENADDGSAPSKDQEAGDNKLTGSLSEPDAVDVAAEPSVAKSTDETIKQDEKEVEEKKSKVLDVYDLPPLNLSSDSDDSDEDEEKKKLQSNVKTDDLAAVPQTSSVNITDKASETLSQTDDENQQPVQIVDGIWDNFKTYKANLERRENQQAESTGECSTQKSENQLEFQSSDKALAEVVSIVNMDHDYCGPVAGTSTIAESEKQAENTSVAETEPAQSTLQTQVETEKLEETTEKMEDEEKKVCGDDHNYCYTNTTSLCVEKEKETISAAAAPPPVPPATPSKKKQKSPKKKQKRSASSSSSDSSSNSDSSTCSCGTNCSCSSSSSSSSGSSSSQSSDSDSSSSEGKRRQAARRERRRERAKKRKIEETESTAPVQVESTEPVAANGQPVLQDEVAPVANVTEPEEVDLPIRESDLDTDETETDEDFYDKYPQRLANKLLAEKRNQLLLLAAVAPVNNGTMSQSGQSPPPSSIDEPVPKKKAKTKKHRKSQHQRSNMENKMESQLKLNIPSDYYGTQAPAFSKSSVPPSPASNSTTPTTLTAPARAQSSFLSNHPEPLTPSAAYQSTGSGSETDSKRLSKRKRVPKRFYGDSSDEELDHQPPVKWRKVMPSTSGSPVPGSQPVAPFTYKSSSTSSVPEPVRGPPAPIPTNEDKSEDEAAEDSDSDREDPKKSSTESSNSESEGEKDHDDEHSDDESDADASSETQTNTMSTSRDGDNVQQKNENLYCYCQCPYDEVSEMIACDGKDCTIEWFHFECVGIMVPPKGKWFCPDCRKRSASKSEFLVSV